MKAIDTPGLRKYDLEIGGRFLLHLHRDVVYQLHIWRFISFADLIFFSGHGVESLGVCRASRQDVA